jgi:hypothetical protein
LQLKQKLCPSSYVALASEDPHVEQGPLDMRLDSSCILFSLG